MRYFLQDDAGGGDGGGGGGAATVAGAGGQDTVAAGGADTVAGGGGGDITWPADWRERMAKGTDGKVDDKRLARLQRYASPEAYNDAHFSLLQKMSSGELKANTPFPVKGTPEEQNAWRKEQGVPEKPEGYDLTLPNGVVIGEADKPLVDEFLKFAHANNIPTEAVKGQLAWYLGDLREKAESDRAEAEAGAIQRTEDELRKEWGADYRPNVNAINALLDSNVAASSDLKARILRSIKMEPEFAKLFANIARQINPVSTLTGIDPARMEQSIDAEIKVLEGQMKAGRGTREGDKYWKDDKAQARYRELLDARERMAKRNVA